MKLLDNKKCVIISWDKDEHIYGIKIKRGKGNSISVLNAYSSKDEGFNEDELIEDSFGARLAAIYKKLYPGEQFLVMLTGNIPGSVCFEMKMPKMAVNDIADAVKYEIPRYIPVDISSVHIGFRVIRQEENSMLLRIFVVKKDNWEQLLEVFRETKIKMDFVLHPFMATDPWLKDKEQISLEQLYPGFAIGQSTEDNLRHFVAFNVDDDEASKCIFSMQDFKDHFQVTYEKEVEQEPGDDYLPCFFIAGYAVSSVVQRDQLTLLAPPKELKPERFRGLKWVFFVFLAIVAGLIISFVGRVWFEKRDAHMKVEKEIKVVSRAITDAQNDMRRQIAFQDFAEKIINTELGNNEIYHGILEITTKLPKDLWVKNLTANGYNISLTLHSEKKSSADFYKRLRNFEVFSSPYSKKTPTGYNIYLTLRYKHPLSEKREEEED